MTDTEKRTPTNDESTPLPDSSAAKSIPRWQWLVTLPLCAGAFIVLFVSIQGYRAGEYANLAATDWIGLKSRIHRTDGEQFLWAYGPRDPEDPQSEWFDMTGSQLPLEQFEHGIGRDSIAAIEDPKFADFGDPVFQKKMGLNEERLNAAKVIGFAHAGEARAYPIQIMNTCELVNDTVGGKPVTVGW
ncbi:MAG: DUF3179 domain-containing protein [Planctomycetes bacterium]|nr:DUF3179 domain-containing protein [Planctomycetota bacterium]